MSPAEMSQPFPADVCTPEKDTPPLGRSTSQSLQSSQGSYISPATALSVDTSLSTLTKNMGLDPFESFSYSSRQGSLAHHRQQQQPVFTPSNLSSPFGSSGAPSVSSVGMGGRSRRAPPALRLDKAVDLRREKMKVVPVGVGVDGLSVTEEVELEDDEAGEAEEIADGLRSGAEASSADGASPAEVGFARMGERVLPARLPSLTRIERRPPSQVGLEAEGTERARAAASFRAMWRAGAGAGPGPGPVDPRARWAVAKQHTGSLESKGGEDAGVGLGSKWSVSTVKTKASE